MVASLLKPARCVLMIGDDGLAVYDISARKPQYIDTVPWQAEGFEQIVADHIRKDCGSKPVLLVNDMTDQHFKGGQRMPKVGAMDQANVLKRRLNVAFPSYPIRGALKIKTPRGEKNPSRSAGPMYLFAATPMSEAIVKAIAAVRLSMAPIAGFVLLPVEASDMVQAMSQKLAGKGEKAAKWTIFIGQHRSGALRQVITRNGQLAMTRMTPIINDDSDPGVWAREVQQELKATVSYLSRFGFEPDDGVDLFVIAGEQSAMALEGMIDIPCRYTPYTASEAAAFAGLKIDAQAEQRFADTIHATYIGQKSRFLLPMDAPELSKVYQPRQVAALAIFLMILSGGYLAWQSFDQTQSLLTKQEELSNQKRIRSQVMTEYNAEVQRMESLGFNVKVVRAVVELYRQIDKSEMKPLVFIEKLDKALGPETRVDAVTMELTPKVLTKDEQEQRNRDTRYGEQKPIPMELLTNLRFSFPDTMKLETGVSTILDIEKRLNASLGPQGYSVKIVKQVGGLDVGQTVTGESGRSAKTIAEKAEREAEITIKGPLQ